MKRTRKVAFAGVFAALCIVFLFIGSLFQTLDLSAAAFASLVVLIAFIELGKGWAFGIYVTASVISLLMLPQKTAAAVFALFLGFYPVLKEFLNRIKPIWLSYFARIFCFNVFLTALIFAAQHLLYLEEEFLGFELAIYLLSNITFLVFDLALERIANTYVKRIRPRISKRKY